MTNNIARTLQLVSIQHELAMAIGSHLELDKMLAVFMERALHRLSLSDVVILYDLPLINEEAYGEMHSVYSFPKNTAIVEDWVIQKARVVHTEKRTTFLPVEYNADFYYLFWVPDFGVLVFTRRGQSIDKMILDALQPLWVKLATSCIACIDHTSLIEEVEARKNAEHSLIQRSLLDPLTNLPNRKMLNMSLTQAIEESAESGQYGAIFFIDIDRFKVINDSLGHNVGDQVLKFIAKRLLSCLNVGDTLARMGGDEFVLFVTNLSTDLHQATAKAGEVAEKLSGQLAKPLDVQENTLTVSISTGISLFPLKEDAAESPETQCNTLIRNADLAMYRIKRANRNGYSFFSADLQSYSDKRTQVETCLRNAIEKGELELAYQPLMGSSAEIVGAEALLRWNSQTLGRVSPADFIPVAEESGLIIGIGDWVIQQACQTIKLLRASTGFNQNQYISVNVSPRQFNRADFVKDFIGCLRKYEVDSSNIRIEITENVAIGDIDLAVAKMNTLKAYGIDCMLDDFGSGYSSLSYLNTLPLKAIKIDRSFITDIDTSVYHQLIVKAVTDICNYSKLECVAEGVETQAEVEYLAKANLFKAYQGYYFHKPMPETQFLQLIQGNATNHR